MAEYTPGYVDVPGKGKRYRNKSGEFFHNHLGSVMNSLRKGASKVNDAYSDYYDGVADSVGTERRDGSAKQKPKQKPAQASTKITPVAQKPGAPQNSNPFAPNFQPFLIPATAPIRAIIGKPDPERVNAPQQNSNPLAPGFTPFMVPESAPIRQLIKPNKDTSASEDSGMTNRTGVTPIVPEGGTSPSFRAAVEQGEDGGSVPSSGNAGSGGSGIDMSTGSRQAPAPKPDNMAGESDYKRYETWVNHHEGLARKVKKGSAGYDIIQQILNKKDGKPAVTSTEKVAPSGNSSVGTVVDTHDGGLTITPSTPETTSNPNNPQDGASPAPTIADNIRTVRMDRIASEQDDNLTQHYATRTHKDVFDESTNSWKQVPIKR